MKNFKSLPVFVALFFVSFVFAAPAHSEDQSPAGFLNQGRVILPINQVLTPAGKQVELPSMRPQVIKFSPNGKILVTSGKTAELIVLDPSNGKILQRVKCPSSSASTETNSVSNQILKPDKDAQVSYTGLAFSPDSKWIYLSNVNGDIKVFSVDEKNSVHPAYSIPLPDMPKELNKRKKDIPAGLALSPDGSHLYVTLNISNQVAEIDLKTKQLIRYFDVGVCPYTVCLATGKLYVSNWGGSRPDDSGTTGPIGTTGRVRVDPVRFIANQGSVSVIDLAIGKLKPEIQTGRHASAMTLTKNGKYLFIANSAQDSVSVIDTSSDKIIETIDTNWHTGDLFGATPDGLVFDDDHNLLYVCNATQNAICVVSFKPGDSKLLGLIPTAWFPGAIDFDSARKSLYVANIKGVGSWKRLLANEKKSYNSHQYFGTLSLIPVPDTAKLKKYTQSVLKNNHAALKETAMLPPRPNQLPVPIPERTGEPSVIKHVIYIIKENRTYDQVLGDIKQGNGDKNMCVFGEDITPNLHKICREFVLLDNTYCSGILSADGHQWADTGITTDYMEKSFAGFPRSYPDGMGPTESDAMAYSPAGFIWDNAIAHKISLRDYGEFTDSTVRWKDSANKKEPNFLEIYRDITSKTGLIEIRSSACIDSLKPYIDERTIGWGLHVPDMFRADRFIADLAEFEKSGKMPQFIIICLPNDHTSGTGFGAPTPAAQVADNDLAFGRICQAVSKSTFWKDTCIFSIEDDPQSGWDHVSGYRTTAYVISPYTKRGVVVSEKYDQPAILRTMELILGLPPMNQIDAVSTPLTTCFTDKPDFTPYTIVPNNIPLDQMNPNPSAIADPQRKNFAIASASLPLKEVDKCPELLFNKILWNAMKGSHAKFPPMADIDDDD